MATIEPTIHCFSSAEAMINAAAAEIVDRLRRATAGGGRCRWALAGGATPRPVYERMAQPDLAQRVDWERVEIYWGDERCVPPEHAASNYRMAKEALLDAIPIPFRNVYRIACERDPHKEATRYATLLDRAPLDLVLLGMGSDGHTASLFPGATALSEQQHAALFCQGPAPLADRVTITLPTINAARCVMLLVSGANKAERLAEVYRELTSGDEAAAPTLPAANVRPEAGTLLWFVDQAAAAGLGDGDAPPRV